MKSQKFQIPITDVTRRRFDYGPDNNRISVERHSLMRIMTSFPVLTYSVLVIPYTLSSSSAPRGAKAEALRGHLLTGAQIEESDE